jgi:hypothetical protein
MLPRDARERAFSRRTIVLVNKSAKKLALVGEQAADGSVPVEVFEISLTDGFIQPTDGWEKNRGRLAPSPVK